MRSEDVPQDHIVVIRDERLHLLKTDGEYAPRYGNIVENKIKVKDINHDERCAQGNARQNPMYQSLQ